MRLHGRYTEKQTAYLLKKIILAVLVLHRQGIAHRDVKPDNFIFESERIDAELKLIDLGLSQKYMKSGEKVSMSSAVGTPYYTAPEVLRGDYGPECDVWSIGIIMYTMLTGKLPFQGESSEEIKKHIRNGDIVYDPETWNALSVEARNLMMHLLEVEPGRRISLEDAISHPWFSILTDKSQSIDPQILKALRLQRYTSDIQKEAMAILVRHLATNELKELNDAFIQFDKTSTGTINANDLRKLLRTQGVDCAAEEIQQIIANTDIQGKGEINYSEFLAATLKSKQCINDEHLWQVFQRFDLDNTGVISVENVVEIFRQSGKSISQNEVTQMISEVDKVGDGNINFEEFKTFMR